jgi:Cu-Zn family superoxide dismutase
MRSGVRSGIGIVAVASLTAACAAVGSGSSTRVALEPRSGSTVSGTLTLHAVTAGVEITGEVRGLAPGSTHGFHVHEKGDCSALDASSAGPHFNPTGAQHGQAGAGPHHVGDMPNIVADKQGVARVDVVLQGAALDSGDTSLRGRALVVHQDPDDYATQPSGNSGARIACAVIPAAPAS